MDGVGFVFKLLPHLKSVFPYLKPLLYQLRPYETRVEELDKAFNNLEEVRNKLQHRVDEDERIGRAIRDDVIIWLEKVDEVICYYEDFLKKESEEHPYAVCSIGQLPRPGIRYRLSRKVIDLTGRVNVLLQNGNWFSSYFFDDFERIASREETMHDIMAALEDSNIGGIGVYGWSGVGKTSLIKEVAEKVKGIFDVVIMVNVTSHPDIQRIQGQIANMLGMEFEEESESGRAARLRERLKNPKQRTLVILDNMRVNLDFNMLGIPYENNDDRHMNHKMQDPLAHQSSAMKTEEFDASTLMKIEEPLARQKGCKILMVSDSEQVLLSQMNWKRIQNFRVKLINENDAEKMFKTVAGLRGGDHMYETLATQIAKKCKGLPVTIITAAKALKYKSLSVWHNAYLDLESQNLTMPEFSTKLSYNLLESEELQQTFLICACMGQDALITDLLRYCIGLGLLQGIDTVREARDRVHKLVAKLKELSLLSESFSSKCFTMQSIIRDAALLIASQKMPVFALTKEKLEKWPDKDKLESYSTISLQHCDVTDIINEFDEGIDCFKVRIFHLDNKDPHLRIPEGIFTRMKELRVLTLTDIHLSPLPSSIKCLTKLRMLCLERCTLGKKLSYLGELKELRVLSLSGSNIERLPNQLRQLAKLQIFDITNCFELKEIPPDVLSSLTSLEGLYVGNSPIQWNDEERQGNQSGNASLSELWQLSQLTALDIRIPKITHLPKKLFFDKLDRYKIIIRDFNAYWPVWDFKMPETCEASRYLALQLEKGFNIHYQKDIKILFERVENLLLGQLNDVEDILYELNREGFPHLKYLSIVRNSKVKSIINSKNQNHPVKAFPKLESLFLYEVNNMEHICHSQLINDSLSKLKIIKLKMCAQLKDVFFSYMIKHVSALETIEVSECNSLKVIVTMETQDTEDPIEFPELRSLTLQSLSEFNGFYTQVPNRESTELFNRKDVVFSKLERMELSSIKIQKIWSDQPSTSYFQNLMHLDVNNCGNMTYLLSLSMSKNLRNLQSLSLSECGMMERIFKEKEDGIIKIEEIIFKNLKIINLRSMNKLKEIWWHHKFPFRCFGKLDALVIERCNKLQNVFPSYMVRRFQSLCNLKVTNCKSMTEIFDLKDCGKQDVEFMTNLQNIYVEALPKLESIWKKDSKGILNFKNLRKIWIKECLRLDHIFPVSIAIGLKKLESLEVWNCGQLKEIVSMGEANNKSIVSFEFPKLTTARFWKLPNLERFYGGTHELHCSTLNNLSVELCRKLRLFRGENENREIKPIFLTEKVFYNLKSMQIESRDANGLKTYMENYPMHKLEEFQLSRLVDTKILYFFLHRNPNLKSLLLSNCFFEQLVPLRNHAEEKLGVVPKLRSLKLMNLPSLKMIGFEEDTVLFQRLECLVLKECPCLNTIAPSSVSFTCLTNLEVIRCNELSYLMTPSTAKSLFQLTTMKVIQCESMETIVSEQEDEELEWIIFRQLKEIELVALHKLESFCSSNHCVIKFPSLEKVVVSACCKMEMFTFSDHNETLNLRQICVTHVEEEKRLYWKDDLNATMRHIYETRKCFEGMEEMSLTKHPELRQVWKGGVDLQNIGSRFYSLKILKLENSEIQPCAIPSHILLHLKSLKELDVRNCSNLKVIFEMHETEVAGTACQLQKLNLQGLSMLMHVWERNGKGTHSFQNLQVVSVSNCDNLKTLFPVAVAKNLKKLDKLEIENCDGLLEIVGQEEDTALEETQEFVFPCLTTLILFDLPELIYFYPNSFTLECSVLYKLIVLYCAKLELFESANRQPLFVAVKDIANLEELSLDWEHTLVLSSMLTTNLEHLNNFDLLFDVDVDENQKPIWPIQFIQKAPNLKEISIQSCSCLEVFHTEIPEHDMLTHLKILRLRRVWKLQSIGSKDSPCLNMICKKIDEFNVFDCPHLTTLVHSNSTVSFSDLKELNISHCHGLEYLFTSSAAKKLVHLEHIKVWRCESIEKIVAKEQNETIPGELKLERLHSIDLNFLSSLECFYSGNETLQLPSLIQMDIWNCPKMEFFCAGSINLNDQLVFYGDLNYSIKKMFLLQEFFEALDYKCFSDNLYIQADWPSKVVVLKLDKCNLSFVVPYAILPLLKNLKELEVRGSHKVEVIFYMKEEIMEKTSQLEKLTLRGLPKLTRVWQKYSEGVFIFQNLREVIVSDCKNLQTLFPASLAKNLEKLEKLEIESCHKFQEIVENEEGTTTNVTEKFVFPHLENLKLCHLPQLTYFYPQTFTMECPSLNSLYVLNCHELELFESAHLKAEGVGRNTLINRQPLISNLKVIFNLKELRLDWKHILAISSRFESEQFTEELKDLKHIALSYFDTDENEMPMLPIEILQKAPNLIEMTIDYCNYPKFGEDRMLGQFTKLILNDVWKLPSIESEDESEDKSENESLLNTICEKLHKLKVLQCPRMTTLVDATSTVSFSCLKKVSISSCPKLQYLFTSSAAKKLTNLEKITVKKCDSVKDILANEGDATSDVIKFRRLHTINLHSLPSLVCFYSGSGILQLSSLKKVHIWQCHNMKIFSEGVINAESFGRVQMSSGLKQDSCINQSLNATIKGMQQRLEFFEALDEARSSGNLALQADRHVNVAVGLQNKWLRHLVTLKLHNWTLPYVIPSHILPHLMNLKELEVHDSDKVEAIFYMNDTEIVETVSQMKKLTLNELSELRHVWGKNSQEVLIFRNLEEVIVSDCKNLQILFPASLAKKLEKLEKLEIRSCHKLQAIVQKEEGTTEVVTEKFVFPRLEVLDLHDLPRVSYFYPQTFTLGCPALNKLSVLNCHKLELFQGVHPSGEGTSIDRRPLISNLKVISNLKELRLDWKHISALSSRFRSGRFAKGLKYLNEFSMHVGADEDEKPMLLNEILRKAPYLIEMGINNCNSPDIFLSANLSIEQLRILKLCEVSKLHSIKPEDSSWRNTICEKIQELNVVRCPHLTTLVHSTSTVFFSCLKKIRISNCHILQYLCISSSAKFLLNLEEIIVEECDSVKEILVAKGGATSEDIQFDRLKSIVLQSLPSLTCFYSGKDTLRLSSLKAVHISKCPNMKIFSQGVIHAESFKGIQMSRVAEQDFLFHQDLNASIKVMLQRQEFFDAHFRWNYELQADSQGDVAFVLQNKWLSNLRTLNLAKCILPCAIPSVILPLLKNLKELEVLDSDKVEVIFYMNDIEIMKTASQMKKLTLKGLSELTHVWGKNSEVLIFPNLQEVVVSDCKNLQTLFPSSLAKNLEKLEKLEIESCHKLQAIVEKEVGTTEEVTEKFVFPRLKKLNLCHLPQVTYFYPQTFTLECPILNSLSVLDCHKLELFQCAHLKAEGEGTSTSFNRQPLISNLKVISNLKELQLDWIHISALNFRVSSGQFLTGLEYLNEITLSLDAAKNDKPMLPVELLQQAPNLKAMSINNCNSPEIFLSSNPVTVAIGRWMLKHLIKLRLCEVSELLSIKSKYSTGRILIFEMIKELNVVRCPHLTTLIHSTSTVSFSCMKKISIYKCHKLQYLFTSAVAKMLMNLEEIMVEECELVKEIMAKEGDTTSATIKFWRLNTIALYSLPSLVCFYSGSDTLQLSSLTTMRIRKCHNMKKFSDGVVFAGSFQGIQMFSDDPKQDFLFHQNINTTMKAMLQRQEFFDAIVETCSPSSFELQADRDGNIAIGLQNKWLRNLRALNLIECILPCAIPSVILPLLKNLKELEVRDSDKVEVIFNMNDSEIMEASSPMKKLTLKGLPELIRVCGKNSKAVLLFPNLQEIVVSDCKNLETLFPASLAKNLKKLEKLEIEYCHKLQTIVEKEGDKATNITEKFVFPCLEKLNLCHLPRVTNFYPQTFTLECPALNNLHVSDCHELELFQSGNSMDEGEGTNTSINRQPLISNLKVISKLKELELDWKHISALKLWFGSEQFTEGLKDLKHISLLFGANENESSLPPIEILGKAPNLIEMGINNCYGPEIFLPQNPKAGGDEMLTRLKTLKLCNVSMLQSIKSEGSSWLNTIREKLQELHVVGCLHLTTLVQQMSFSSLKKVSISNCPKLQYIFTSSTANKLMFLEEIKVEECESLEEIVAKGLRVTSEVVKIDRLKNIVLHSLPSLIRFYSSSDTLQLPSLITVHIRKCPNMKIFSEGVIYAESFQGIQMSSDPKQNLLFYKDLNATIKGMLQRREFFEAVNEEEDFLSDQDEEFFSDQDEDLFDLQADRHGNVAIGGQNKWLHNLRELKLDKCVLQCAIPSVILFLLKNLKELEVRDSTKVEVIFDLSDTDITEVQLKKLTLKGLSKLTRVWGKNSQGLLRFPDLQDVLVSECNILKTLFPASLAKNLEKLEKLEIESCHKLQAIVEKEEWTPANVTETFVFPRLEKLILCHLPRVTFTYFYPQTFTLECPALNSLYVLDCHELELFQSAHLEADGESRSAPINRHPLISNLMVISNLKELTLDWRHILALKLRIESAQFMEDLEDLKHIALSFHADENQKPMFPFEILQKAPSLIEMSINTCNSPEIFFAQNHKIGEDGVLEQLRVLKLSKISELQSINSEDSSWLKTICEKIRELHVSECPHLITLAQTSSFSCLKEVCISNCPDLQYLFSSSAVKMLVNLEEITIEECESVKEIVAKVGDETSEVIKFERLNKIVLHSLQSLLCFYSGNDTLELSSLIIVHIKECPSIKIFSQGLIYAESFLGIQMSSDPKQDLLFHQDINATIKRMLQRQEFFKAVEESEEFFFETMDFDLQADENGNVLVGKQNKWLGNLRELKLDNCILPYAIPSAILLLLKNLTELEVRDSNKVEVIFDMNDTEITEATTQLKKLTLKGLSELKCVWEENSQGVFSFQNLKEVVVSDCKILQTLFPTSMARTLEKLEKLEIKSCHKLQEIVEKEEKLMNLEDCGSVIEIVPKEGAEDEHTGEGEDKYENEMIFAKLEILTLDSLPKFKSFYTGSATLNFPSLKVVQFNECFRVKIFRHGDKVPVELKVAIDGVHQEGGIDSVIIQQFEELVAAYVW